MTSSCDAPLAYQQSSASLVGNKGIVKMLALTNSAEDLLPTRPKVTTVETNKNK